MLDAFICISYLKVGFKDIDTHPIYTNLKSLYVGNLID